MIFSYLVIAVLFEKSEIGWTFFRQINSIDYARFKTNAIKNVKIASENVIYCKHNHLK
jgi:hypothetical protein